ncbi:MAG TPA: 3-deoxy-manno-octulosonate cytidylyltransferase [Burkholderiales bacterium]|nr:3-deoxy-manno-octulosonate cytidylyltransferase [Burkholderiales bacterium]
MRAVCVIPARMGSSRFPGKPLEPLLGLPLILHVWRRCRLFSGFERLVVATCDEPIRRAVEAAGGEVVMTSDSHERATDRVVETIGRLELGLQPDDFVLMVQGDEILVTPTMLSDITDAYVKSRSPVVNLVSALYRTEDHDSPHTVKVVADLTGRALYMSRAPIPSRSRAKDGIPMFQQTGVIGFSAEFLKRYGTLAPTPLEKVESVDMMRVIEHGYPVQLVTTSIETIGVDTPEDLKRAEDVLRADPLVSQYL